MRKLAGHKNSESKKDEILWPHHDENKIKTKNLTDGQHKDVEWT